MNINEIHSLVQKKGIVFLSYGGFLSQALIAAMTEALEKETEANELSMSASNNIFTVFIELAQNMMNYSKSISDKDDPSSSESLIMVSRDKTNWNYYIESQNIISVQDKELIEEKLQFIQTLNKDEIKKQYRELRRSGKNTHHKGGGIGFYEIAKRCESLNFEFNQINDEKFYFHLKTQILIK
jgi:hypothetical protein